MFLNLICEGLVNNVVEDVNFESRDCNEGVLFMLIILICFWIGDDVILDVISCGIFVIMEDFVCVSRNIVFSGFLFRFKGDGWSYSRRDIFGSLCFLWRKYYKMGGRCLFVGIFSN